MKHTKRLFARANATLLSMLCTLYLHVGIFSILLAALLHRRAGFRQGATTTAAGSHVLGSAVNTADHAVQTAAQIHDDTARRWVALSARLVDDGNLEAAIAAAYVVGRYGAELPPAVAAHASLKAAFERGTADARQEAAGRGATRLLAPLVR